LVQIEVDGGRQICPVEEDVGAVEDVDEGAEAAE
jgi:hypothetical protein